MFFKKKEVTPVSKPIPKVEPEEEILEDGELPWGWYTRHKSFTEPIEKEHSRLLRAWVDSRSQAPSKCEAALLSFVDFLHDTRKLCTAKGECYAKWFSDIIASDEYIMKRKHELNSLSQNLPELERIYTLQQSLTDDMIVDVIKNHPGILQTDVYKNFDPCLKETIYTHIYYMVNNGKVKRQKSGRTYALYLA